MNGQLNKMIVLPFSTISENDKEICWKFFEAFRIELMLIGIRISFKKCPEETQRIVVCDVLANIIQCSNEWFVHWM